MKWWLALMLLLMAAVAVSDPIPLITTNEASQIVATVNALTQRINTYMGFNSDGNVQLTNGLSVESHRIISAANPSVQSGFCSGATVVPGSGTAAFEVDVGTSCATSTGVLNMPQATTGWVCSVQEIATPGTNVAAQSGETATTVSVSNYRRSNGAPLNWVDGDLLHIMCMGY